ncbi:MAG: thioredoxin domain-containing protein [Chitinophagaceae bacterium]
MKNVFPVFLLLIVALSCNSQQVIEADPSEFEKGLDKEKAQILDVRTAGEYQSGHIKNALQADWTNREQFLDRVQYIDKDKPVYIYCLSGGRSTAAAAWMRNNGFKKVTELRGGFMAWKRENKPVEGKTNEPQLTPEQYFASIPKDKPVLVDFGAPWCPPCVKMEPVIREIEKKADKKFVVMRIDAGIHTNLLKTLGIEPIPVFIVYRNGKEVWRKQGLVRKEALMDQLK